MIKKAPGVQPVAGSGTDTAGERLPRACVYGLLFTLAIGLLVFAAGILPLYHALVRSQEELLRQRNHAKFMLVEAYLRHAQHVVRQLAGQAHPRRLLERHLPQGGAHDAEQATGGTMTGATTFSAELAGAVRLDAHGRELTAVGRPIPRGLLPAPSPGREVELHGPLTLDGEAFVLLSASVRGERLAQVGTDYVLFRAPALDVGNTWIGRITTAGAERLLLSSQEETPPPAIETALRDAPDRERGIVSARQGPQAWVIAYARLPGSDWVVASWAERDVLYAAVHRRLAISVAAVLLLLGAGAVGATVGLRRLVGRVVARTAALESREHDGTSAQQALRQSKERIERLVHYDALTGLPNRMLFRDRFEQALLQAQRQGRTVALLYVDLDRFKLVNDSLGQAAGDELLRQVAHRLCARVRRSDTVARLGGDEFAIILSGLRHADDAARLAQHVVDILREPFDLHGREQYGSASVGVAVYPGDVGEPERLIRNAHTAMHRIKELGGGGYAFYAAEMDARAHERLALENDLCRALDRGEFVLFYQPQVDLVTGRVVGHEALLRWQHRERGLVSPADFIPLLEDNGLIVPVGAWVLRTACEFNLGLRAAGLPPMRVAVNLSARQFRQGRLAETVERILHETGHDPSALELEITESLLLHNMTQTVKELHRLRQLGVRFAIDDFGTGYSSLGYLSQLPVDRLKIDRAFVQGLPAKDENAVIVKTIITLAHNLNVKVIAEGVESRAQIAFLHAHRCDEIQGYYFSRPQRAEACMITAGRHLTVAERRLGLPDS